MRRADGFHLRRRTADLSEDRGTRRRPAASRAASFIICTNGMFMRKKMRDYLAALNLQRRGEVAEADRNCSERETDHREGRRDRIRKGRGLARSRHRADAMDVLERPRRRPRIHARSHRRARRRLQGMRRGDQDGQDSRLPGRHQHDRLQGDRSRRRSSRCSSSSSRSAWTATPFRPATNTTPPRRTWSSGSDSDPEEFFLTRKMTRREVREDRGMGANVHHLRHAGLSGIPRRQTRADLHRLGHSHPQHQRLESPVLPDDRRPLRHATRRCWRRWTGTNTASSNGVARDPRCENCMVHCGYDPSGALGIGAQPGDLWKTIKFNFGPRPAPVCADGIDAFNGTPKHPAAGAGRHAALTQASSALHHVAVRRRSGGSRGLRGGR